MEQVTTYVGIDAHKKDLLRCRHRLSKVLLRRGLHYSGRNWTCRHRRWVDSLTWTHAAERAVVETYLLAIDHTEVRLVDLDARLGPDRRARAVPDAGRLAAVLPRHRYAIGDAHPGRAA